MHDWWDGDFNFLEFYSYYNICGSCFLANNLYHEQKRVLEA